MWADLSAESPEIVTHTVISKELLPDTDPPAHDLLTETDRTPKLETALSQTDPNPPSEISQARSESSRTDQFHSFPIFLFKAPAYIFFTAPTNPTNPTVALKLVAENKPVADKISSILSSNSFAVDELMNSTSLFLDQLNATKTVLDQASNRSDDSHSQTNLSNLELKEADVPDPDDATEIDETPVEQLAKFFRTE